MLKQSPTHVTDSRWRNSISRIIYIIIGSAFFICYTLIISRDIATYTNNEPQSKTRRSMLLSGNEPISSIPTGAVLPGVSYFNKIYNMLDGTDLLEKSGRDIYTFRYASSIQTWTSQHTYLVPVEFAGVPNIYPQFTKDNTLSTMKKTWSSSLLKDVSSSRSSGSAITLSQIGAILAPIVNAISPGVGTAISAITSSDAFKDAKASIQNGNSRNIKEARTKKGEGFEKNIQIKC
eukprot:458880_1